MRATEADRIVDATIRMAECVGWENLRLHSLADELGLSLDQVRLHFRDLDQVANVYFERAHLAMLAPPAAGFAALPARERLYQVILKWFDALALHRKVTAEMLATKLYPSHPHHWVPLIFNLSRTIHWVREAALLDAGGLRRQAEEVGLTLILLAILAVWVRDAIPEQARTRRFLRRKLERAEILREGMERFLAAGPGGTT